MKGNKKTLNNSFSLIQNNLSQASHLREEMKLLFLNSLTLYCSQQHQLQPQNKGFPFYRQILVINYVDIFSLLL